MKRKEFIQLTSFTGLSILLHPFSSIALPIDKNIHVHYFSASDKEFDTLRQGFNTRIQQYPKMIAVCNDTQGVQEAIVLAKKINIAVSIQSGGHCMEGFSGNTGGMQLVLRNMNTITWNKEYEISVGPGVTLQKIYEELISKNKIIPGGSCAGVRGVGRWGRCDNEYL